MSNVNKVIILLGPTSSGKTGASILLAKALGTEIISADSMQLYRGMDIGTAKPSAGQLAEVRHHLIDVIDPWEEFSAGRFLELAVPVMERLHREGRIPLVVGGTGLYIKALTRGLFSAPGADHGLREELLRMEEGGGGSLMDRLRELDPEAARCISPGDTRRLVRALEVCIRAKAPVSELRKELTAPLPCDFIKTGITRGRGELYTMIEERVDRMLARGLVNEVKKIVLTK